MQKYRVFEKLKKTRHCSYYNAQNLITHQTVTIKKLSRHNNWEQLLGKRQIALMKQQNFPFLAKIKEIIKENGKFFVVHESLTQCVDDLKKKSLSLADVASIGKQMIEISVNLFKEGVTLAEIRPQFYFVNKKRVKLAHIVSVPSDGQMQFQDCQDFRYYAPEVTLSNKMSNPEESNIFSVGLIMCELMLGRPLIPAKNKLDYMYMLCGLFPRQKLENSSTIQTTSANQTLKAFQDIMQPVCSSAEFIDLLEDMTRVNSKARLNYIEALKRLKQIENRLTLEQQQKNSPKKKLDNIDAKSILASMSKATKQINDERFKLSPSNPQRNKDRLITTNHQINLQLENEVYDKIGFMPPIPRECQVLKTEKNVQDNAHVSHIGRRKNFSQLVIPVSTPHKTPFGKNFPLIRTSAHYHTKQSRQKINHSTGKMLQKTVTNYNPSKQMRLKTEHIAIQRIAPQTQNLAATQKSKKRMPQLTNYARNNNNHLGVEIAQQEGFYSQTDFD